MEQKLPKWKGGGGPTDQPKRPTFVGLKQQYTQVTQILLAMQLGRTNSKDLVSDESSELPPTLTKDGRMYHGKKHKILDCLVPDLTSTGKPQIIAAILDGPVVIQTLRPLNTTTIEEYTDKIVYPHLFTWMSMTVLILYSIYIRNQV